MRKWKMVSGLLAIFLSGILIGSVGTGIYVRHVIRARVDALVRGDRSMAVQLVMERLTRSLGLNAEQRAAIEPIVQEAARKIRAIRAKLRPEFMEVFLQTSGKIKAHLTKEQRKKIDRLTRRIREGLSGGS